MNFKIKIDPPEMKSEGESLDPVLEENEKIASEIFDRPNESKELEEIPPKIFGIKVIKEPITIDTLNNAIYELGVVSLCWPEIKEPVFETRTCFPESYYTNTNKEKLLLAYAENFRRQFQFHYNARKPLFLQAPNECGLQKQVCTSIRPTKLCYADTTTWQGIASLVADFFEYEPLRKPMLQCKMARLFLLEDCIEEERLERRRYRRHLRESFDPNIIPDIEFVANYRLSRELFQTLCEEIIPLLRPKKNTRGIDPVVKVLTTLNFYARGSYQGSVAQNLEAPMSQQSVSRCIREVTMAINTMAILTKYIKFPQGLGERNTIKRKFYELHNIPGVVGCIDCTHIAIIKPGENEERYFNRKHFHSLNTQVICDSHCNILNVDARYGGATHDSFVWANSEIKSHLENLNEDTTFLLGDSGYALREYMMTPFENVPEDSPEGRFNILHKRVRSTIERTFGILKGRWRCLLAARELHYVPETAGKIIIACCVLHNLCTQAGLEAPELTGDDLRVEASRQIVLHAAQSSTEALQRGQTARARLMLQLQSSQPNQSNR